MHSFRDLEKLEHPNSNLLSSKNKNFQLSGSLPLISGKAYEVLLIGEKLRGRQFVLTPESAPAGASCSDFSRTSSFTLKSPSNGEVDDQVFFLDIFIYLYFSVFFSELQDMVEFYFVAF